MQTKKTQKKRLTKRMYVFLAFVTMAAVSLFAKPIKRGFSSLEKYLSKASYKKTDLRTNLETYSKQRQKEAITKRQLPSCKQRT